MTTAEETGWLPPDMAWRIIATAEMNVFTLSIGASHA